MHQCYICVIADPEDERGQTGSDVSTTQLAVALARCSRSSRMRSDTLCVVTNFSLHGVTVKRSM